MDKELFKKIKIGDKVKIREDLVELYKDHFRESDCRITKSMLVAAGRISTVTNIRETSRYGSVYGIELDTNKFFIWTPSMIEKVIKHIPERCLTKREFAALRVGDTVKIVDLRPVGLDETVECGEHFVPPMEKYLGKTFKVKERIDPNRIILKGTDFWTFTKEMIEKVVEEAPLIDYSVKVEMSGKFNKKGSTKDLHLPGEINENTYITNVFYNNPFTVVKFSDGSVTKCKCEDTDTYDKEKGFAICIMKKFLGNKQTKEMLSTWTDTELTEVNLAEIRKKQKAEAKKLAQTKAAEKVKKEYEAAKKLVAKYEKENGKTITVTTEKKKSLKKKS